MQFCFATQYCKGRHNTASFRNWLCNPKCIFYLTFVTYLKFGITYSFFGAFTPSNPTGSFSYLFSLVLANKWATESHGIVLRVSTVPKCFMSSELPCLVILNVMSMFPMFSIHYIVFSKPFPLSLGICLIPHILVRLTWNLFLFFTHFAVFPLPLYLILGRRILILDFMFSYLISLFT